VSGGIGVNFYPAGAVNGVGNGLGSALVGSQSYGVSGAIAANVINQASPLINNPTINLGAVRVGDAAPTANVSITNVATTAPQAALDASVASNGSPITAGGSFNLLAPGGTSTNQLTVGLNTAVAGNYTGANAGSATVSLISDAANVGGCAPNCQMTLASQQVAVSGQVFTPAIAQVNTSTIDFGIVHTGDAVATRGVSVTNAAAATALNDVLTGSITSAGHFMATGTLAGITAQGTDAASFQAGLNTSASGVFDGAATLTFASHNNAMSDLALGSQQVTLEGHVNNYAQAAIADTGGAGTLTHSGNTYTLNFGDLKFGGESLTDTLAILNSAFGLADLLGGSFKVSGVAPEFALTGFDAFSGIAAGGSQGGLEVVFNSSTAGVFDDAITLSSAGSNASGYSGALGDITRNLEGDVTRTAAVPEPRSNALMFIGLLGVIGVSSVRRRRHQKDAR
jgi:hypothetical protein